MDYDKEGALIRKHDGGHHGASHHGGHPHLHFHRHDGGVSGHVMRHAGTHEVHHFDHGDHDAMVDLIREHMEPGAPPEAWGRRRLRGATGAFGKRNLG